MKLSTGTDKYIHSIEIYLQFGLTYKKKKESQRRAEGLCLSCLMVFERLRSRRCETGVGLLVEVKVTGSADRQQSGALTAHWMSCGGQKLGGFNKDEDNSMNSIKMLQSPQFDILCRAVKKVNVIFLFPITARL